MARIYTLTAQNISLSQAGVCSPFLIIPSSASGVEVKRIRVNQNSSTTSAMQRIQIYSVVTLGSPAGTSATPQKITFDDPTAKITGSASPAAGNCAVNLSTEVTTKAILWEDAFHVFNGFEYIATPYDVLHSPAAGAGLGVFFPTAPGTTTGWNATLWYAEC